MNKKQVLTYAALLILPFTIYQNYIGYPFIAQLSGIIAFLFIYIDFNKITGRLQYFTLYLTSIILAYISGCISDLFLLSSASILISTIGFSVRLGFIKFLSYSRYRYLELCLLILNLPLVILSFTTQIENWYYLEVWMETDGENVTTARDLIVDWTPPSVTIDYPLNIFIPAKCF